MFSNSSLILVGHGSTLNPDSSAPTYAHADSIRKMGCFGEVACAFWKEEPGMRVVLNMVTGDDVYIVPNFISEGYFTRKVIPREFGLTGPITHRNGRILKYCEPVGNHPGVTELLLRRAREIAPAVPPKETSLIIVGHGTDLNDNSAVAAKREVGRIRELGIYAEVHNAYMEEAPFIAQWDRFTSQRSVVVVPFFIADGLHSFQDIPVLLGIDSERGATLNRPELFQTTPHQLRGRNLYYASSIGTEPLFAELLLDQVNLFDRKYPNPRRLP
jgi:sirohydrochlorin cobaltochelatase